MVLEHNEAYANRLLEEAGLAIKNGSGLVKLLLLAIVFWWLTNLSTAFDPTNRSPGTPSKRLGYISAKIQEVRKSCAAVEDYYEQEVGRHGTLPDIDVSLDYVKEHKETIQAKIGKKQLSETVTNELDKAARKQSIDDQRAAVSSAVEDCRDGAKEAKDSYEAILKNGSLDVTGFKLTNIHYRYYSLVMAALLIGLAGVIGYFQWWIVHLSSEALSIKVKARGFRPGQLEYICLRHPWWLTIPPDRRFGASKVRLSEVFAPPTRFPGRLVLTLLILIALAGALKDALVFQSFVDALKFGDGQVERYLGLEEIPDDFHLLSWRNGLFDPVLIAVALVPLALVLSGALFWFSAGPPLSPRRFAARRALIGVAIAFATPPGVLWMAGQHGLLPRLVWASAPGRPMKQERKELARTGLEAGWYRNTSGAKSTPHFVRANGTIKGLYVRRDSTSKHGISPEAAKAFRDSLSRVAHDHLVALVRERKASFDASAYSEGVEAASLALWRGGDQPAALALLGLANAEFRYRDLRLQDLYAGLLVRAGKEELLVAFIQAIDGDLKRRGIPGGANNGRKGKWLDRNGNWYSGWTQEFAPKRKWNGIDV